MKEKNHIIVFDWDDTLCASTWHNANFSSRMMNNASVIELSRQVKQILEASNNLATVLIITNAELDWVLSMTGIYFSDVKILNKIRVISARDYATFERDWKNICFEKELSKLLVPDIANHIVSIGDSIREQEALMTLSEKYDFIPKSVKLVNSPSIKQLTDQLKLLNNSISDIIKHDNKLDLKITHKNLQDYQHQDWSLILK